ncbi:hypothetical protein DLJ49_07775 [Rhodovulum sp. 12E13]|nr:hypothetical protein DLJ49_07775 [Rhodovulum sp. 12E13]
MVVFAGLSRFHLSNPGKVTAETYLPALCTVLREAGFDTRFVTSVAALEGALDRALPAFVVMIYREEHDIPSGARLDAALARAELVFNHPETGRIVADKRRTNEVLTAAGVPMPRMVSAADAPVFSNAVAESAQPVQVVESGASLDPFRYNTEFIDTRIEYGGKDYYSTVRVMCIGAKITHAFVRARDAAQNDASVHTKDTPVDARMINDLHERLVEATWDHLSDIARRVSDALGPGFYAHDVLVERESGRVLVCETGFKFDNKQYSGALEPIRHLLPAWQPFHSPADNARNSAPHLIAALEERLAASSA